MKQLWLGLILLSLGAAAQAEMRQYGDYEVHYSLFQSLSLIHISEPTRPY